MTTTVAFGGYQFVNRTAAGPIGLPRALRKRPEIDVHKYTLRVPPDEARRLEGATRLLAKAASYGKWLRTGEAPPGSADAPTTKAKRAALTATTKGALKAFAKSVGFTPGSTPTSAEVGRVSKAGKGGQPAKFMARAQLDRQRAKVRAGNALYGFEGVRIAVDKVVAFIKEGQTAPNHQLIDDYVDRFRTLAAVFHALDAQLNVTSPEKAEHAELQTQWNEAQNALREHRGNLPSVGDAWSSHLVSALDADDEALAARAQAEHNLATSEARLRRVQDERMDELTSRPPGLPASSAALTDSLTGLRDRLLARPRTMEHVALDAVMEITINQAMLEFSKMAGAQMAVAAEAIQDLSQTDLPVLVAALGDDSQTSSPKVRLASGLVTLPRGVELLSAICKPSTFLAPAPASDSNAHKRAAAELGGQRLVALQTLTTAAAGLTDASIDPATRKHLTLARSAALAALRRPNCSMTDAAPEARYAFNSVRNGLTMVGTGSIATAIDDYLKEVSGSMLQSASRSGGVHGVLANALPIATPTPLSPTAMAAAETQLKQAGLIADTLDAVTSMRNSVRDLRSGNQVTVAERALRAISESMTDAIPQDEPERLASLQSPHVRVPLNFGLDDTALQGDDQLRDLWNRYTQNEVSATDVARELATLARARLTATGETDAAKQVTVFRNCLDLAKGSAIWQSGRIETPRELSDGLVAVARLLKLRHRLKFTGGNVYGVDTSKFPANFNPGVPLNFRLNLSGRLQQDRVIEMGMSTQAYYLTIGSQTTKGGTVGGSVGVSPAYLNTSTVSIGGRIEVGAAVGFERQTQEGLLLRIPRDKTTEERNLAECEEMIRHAVRWKELEHDGPLQGILSNVDAASINFLGAYQRDANRREVSIAGFPVQVGFPAGRVQARSGGQLRWRAESKDTIAEEVTGHYKYDELRKDRTALHQRTGTGTASVRVGQLGEGQISFGDMFSGSRTADWLRGAGTLRRLVTMDGVTAPLRTRLVIEFADLNVFTKAMDDDKGRWINHGNAYTKFPEGLSVKLLSTEDDYVDFLADAKDNNNENKQYLLVYCLQEEAAAPLDALGARIEQAQRSGDSKRVVELQAERNLLLDDPSTWQPRRSVVNGKSAQINQPGHAFGVIGSVSANTEGMQNEDLFPRS